jgi:cell wall-associated NlpC family hydrolase
MIVFLGSLALIGSQPAFAASSTGTSTASLQAEAAQIEQQLAKDQNQAQAADTNYNQATVIYQSEQARLVTLQSQVKTERHELRVARIRVRRAVVSAYVYGIGAQAEASAVLSGKNISNANTLATYAGVATHQLDNAVSTLNVAQTKLLANEQHQVQATDAAASASASAATARNADVQLTSNTKSELTKVNGQIAAVIAEQLAEQAKLAAEQAQAAKTAAARTAAQESAQNQSSLAQAIATANPNSTQVTAAAASATSSATTANKVGGPTIILGPSTAAGNQSVETAITFLGVPYLFGGASASEGFDCSGLTLVAWQAAGVSLVHNAYYQYTASTPIPVVNNTLTLEPGDLLFYFFPDDGDQPVTHVVEYVGSGPYGVNTVIAAPESGQNVEYQSVFWGGFVGAGRP